MNDAQSTEKFTGRAESYAKARPSCPPFITAINSISGGGKTTVTRELQKRFNNSKALYFDDRNYDTDSGIEDICQWVKDGADVNVWDLSRLAEDITALINEKIDIIIMDYPFAYRQKQIAPYINFSVFIDTPLDIALARRIIRDYDNNSAAAVFDDMKHYLDKGRNAYLHGLDNGRKDADFLVDGSMPLDEIVDCIYKKIDLMRSTFVL